MKPASSLLGSRSPSFAFSIIELLIVVAVIGVLSSVALIFLGGNHREAMLRVRDRRNAQEITALAMGATAAGAPVVVQGDLQATIQNLMEGREGTQGPFKGRTFSLTSLNAEEIAGAISHLQWKDGMPSYVSSQP